MRHSLKKPLINLTLFIGSFMFVRYLFQEKFASLFFTYIAPIYSPVKRIFMGWIQYIFSRFSASTYRTFWYFNCTLVLSNGLAYNSKNRISQLHKDVTK